MSTLLAAMWDRPVQSWGIVDILKLVILIAAAIAIVVIALKAFEIKIPDWAVKMFWVVVIAVCALIAINIIASL